ncbi:MAG: hypothetical protein ACLRSW_05475 [Christensenellaceae bacterium]
MIPEIQYNYRLRNGKIWRSLAGRHRFGFIYNKKMLQSTAGDPADG